MAKTYLRDGDVLTFANSGSAIASGAVVKMGNTVGVALQDIAATTGTGPVAIDGVFLVPKTTGVAWVAGGKLFWDVSAGKFDTMAATPATGDVTGCAIVAEAAASGDATGYVKFTPGNTDIA